VIDELIDNGKLDIVDTVSCVWVGGGEGACSCQTKVSCWCKSVNTVLVTKVTILYENTDQILKNKLNGPTHYKIDVYTMDTCFILCCNMTI